MDPLLEDECNRVAALWTGGDQSSADEPPYRHPDEIGLSAGQKAERIIARQRDKVHRRDGGPMFA